MEDKSKDFFIKLLEEIFEENIIIGKTLFNFSDMYYNLKLFVSMMSQ